jgi:hypothetical protein
MRELKHKDLSQAANASKDILYLIDYLTDSIVHHETHLKTFKSLVLGAMLTNSLACQEASEMTLDNFKGCKVFLDTNIILSYIGYHGAKLQESTVKLCDALRELGCSLNIYDFTVKELGMVLKKTSRDIEALESGKLLPGYISMYSIINYFRQRGVSSTTIAQYAKNPTILLNAINAEIYITNANLNPKGLSAVFKEMVNRWENAFEKHKPSLTPGKKNFGKLHDLASIFFIKQLRGNRSANLKKPIALFLTSDRGLSRFNNEEMYDEDSMPEVFLDFKLCILLWSRQVGPVIEGLPFDAIIASRWEETLINDEVVRDFVDEFSVLLKEAHIALKDIPYEFSWASLLRTFTVDKTAVTKEKIIALIAKANAIKNNNVENEKIKNQVISKQSREIDNLSGKLKDAVSKVDEISRSKRKLIYIICFLLFFLIFAIIYILANRGA